MTSSIDAVISNFNVAVSHGSFSVGFRKHVEFHLDAVDNLGRCVFASVLTMSETN